MAFHAFLTRQMGKPEGWIGGLVGQYMAARSSGRQRAAWTVGLLDIEPQDRVLEIGCGPGLAIAEVAARLDSGFVTGIDHSEVMIDQASVRNAAMIHQGRVELILRGMDDPPMVRGGFTKVFGISVIRFAPDFDRTCARLLAVLAPGGVLALTHQPRVGHLVRDDAPGLVERLAAALSRAGCIDIRREELALKPAPCVCVLGRRPNGTGRG